MLINPKGSGAAGAAGSPTNTDIRFNACGDAHEEYELIVHEAGHALGLSGFSIYDLPIEYARYVMAHPAIPDSVMNYNHEVPVFQVSEEPDCSPHPFDVMALFALYQTVSP